MTVNASSSKSPSPFFLGWLTLAVLLMGTIIRCAYLGHDNLWMDEINTLIVATNHGYPTAISPEPQSMQVWFDNHLAWQPINWPILWQMLRKNVHLPMYYLFINNWLGVLGTSEVALRSFSVLCSVGMMLSLTVLARTMMGSVTQASSNTALYTAVLVAGSPMLIYYAQEGRMYSLALLLSTVAMLSLWQILHHRPKNGPILRWLLTYLLSMSLGIMTHYIVWFQLPAHAVLWLLAFRQSNNQQRILRPMLIAGVILGGIIAWAVPMVLAQKSHLFATETHFSAGMLHWDRYLTSLLWQPLMVFSGSGTVNKIVCISVLAIACMGGLLGLARHKKLPSSPSSLSLPSEDSNPSFLPITNTLWLWVWLWVPLIFQIMADMVMGTHTVTIVRYTMLASPSIILGVSVLLSQWPKQPIANALKSILLLGVMLLGALNVWPNGPVRPHKRFQTTPFVQQILAAQQLLPASKTKAPSTLIITNGTLASPCTLAYYMHQQHPHQPMVYYINQYQGQPTYPLSATDIPVTWHSYQQAIVFNYRGGTHRGLNNIHEALSTIYRPFTLSQFQPSSILSFYFSPFTLASLSH